MIKLLKDDTRYVHGYANYKNAVKVSPFEPMGPTVGEYPMDAWPVEISEDGKRVGFSYTGIGEDA